MLARHWRVVVVAVVAFVAAAWVGSLGAPPDDAFITYQYAKRLAAGEGFTFWPGAPPTYGATSPLWTLLLAGAARLGWAPHLSGPWLTALCHAGTAGLLVGVAGGWAGLAWATALVPLAQMGGMETGLLVALMLLALALVRREASPLLVGSVAGLLLWTRPDAALFVFALAAAAMGPQWRRWRRGALVILVAGALYLPWALYAWHAFGDLVPLGARGKWAMGWFYGKVTLTRLVARWFPGDLGLLVFVACLAFVAVGARAACREDRRWLPFVTWGIAYGAALRLARAPDFFWYAVPPAWLAVALLFRGLRGLHISAGRHALPAAPVALALLSFVNWQGTAALRVPRVQRSLHQDLARYVRAHARPGDLVAAQEVGNLAYWTDLPILDLLCVTSDEALPEVRLGQTDTVIERRQPAFVVTFNDRGQWRRNYRLVLTRQTGPRANYVIWQHL